MVKGLNPKLIEACDDLINKSDLNHNEEAIFRCRFGIDGLNTGPQAIDSVANILNICEAEALVILSAAMIKVSIAARNFQVDLDEIIEI